MVIIIMVTCLLTGLPYMLERAGLDVQQGNVLLNLLRMHASTFCFLHN